jgi:hypothetical protein
MRAWRLILCCGLLFTTGLSSFADEPMADAKQLTAQVEKLLLAYNKDDTKAFYADWAKAVEAIATAQTYDALYKQGAKKELGEYQAGSLAFRKEGSVLTGDFLVVYFDSKFANGVAGTVSVNFQKEAGGYKFIQVQLAKKQ